MKEGTYITIQSWMRTELGLTGNELLIFALIFGFCQDEETVFKGTLSYMADWIGTSKRTAINITKSLVDKGFIDRIEEQISGVTLVRYKISLGVKNFHQGGEKTSRGGGEKISPNDNDKEIKNKGKDRFIPPTLEEIEQYCRERGNNVDAKRVYDYYTSANWKDGRGNPVKNWKQKIIAVWERSAESPAVASERKKVAYEGKDYDAGFDNNGNFVWG